MTRIRTLLAGLIVLAGAIGCSDEETDANTPQSGENAEPGASDLGFRWRGHSHHPKPDAELPRVDASTDCQDAAVPQEPTKSCGWKRYDQGVSGAVVDHVAFDPRDPALVYATVAGTLYQSTDYGAQWHVQSELSEGVFGRIDFHGPNKEALLASTSNGVGRSTDLGKTWSFISLQGVGTLATSAPSQPLRVYAAIAGGGVMRSDDGGKHWGTYGSGYPYGATRELSVDPRNHDVVIAGVALMSELGGWTTGAVLRSDNGGASWDTVLQSNAWINRVARCRANPDILYTPFETGLARSADGGRTWRILPVPVDTSGNTTDDIAISATDCDDLYINQLGIGPRRSRDGGATFGPRLTNGLHLNPQGGLPGNLATDPRDMEHVLLSSHGGLYETLDAGASWTLKPGLYTPRITSLATSAQHPGRLWMSTWGTGFWSRASSTATWQRVTGLAVDYGLSVAPDPFVPDRVFASGPGAGTFASNDASSFSLIVVPGNVFGFAFDPSNPETIYAHTQINGIYKSTDGGHTFATSNGGLSPWLTPVGNAIDIRALVVDPAQPTTLYASGEGRGVFKSLDGGATWQSVLSSAQSVRCLLMVGPATVYACINGVQVSHDGGSTWQSVSDGLPSLEVNALTKDEQTGTLYVGTATGLFAKKADQAWKSVDAHCLPSAGSVAIVNESSIKQLVVSSKDGLYARPL